MLQSCTTCSCTSRCINVCPIHPSLPFIVMLHFDKSGAHAKGLIILSGGGISHNIGAVEVGWGRARLPCVLPQPAPAAPTPAEDVLVDLRPKQKSVDLYMLYVCMILYTKSPNFFSPAAGRNKRCPHVSDVAQQLCAGCKKSPRNLFCRQLVRIAMISYCTYLVPVPVLYLYIPGSLVPYCRALLEGTRYNYNYAIPARVPTPTHHTGYPPVPRSRHLCSGARGW